MHQVICALYKQKLGMPSVVGCSRCEGLDMRQFCTNFVLPLVNWRDAHTSGLRQFDDWCAAAMANSLDVTIFVHDVHSHRSSDPYNGRADGKPVVRLLRRGGHYDAAYT